MHWIVKINMKCYTTNGWNLINKYLNINIIILLLSVFFQLSIFVQDLPCKLKTCSKYNYIMCEEADCMFHLEYYIVLHDVKIMYSIKWQLFKAFSIKKPAIYFPVLNKNWGHTKLVHEKPSLLQWPMQVIKRLFLLTINLIIRRKIIYWHVLI